MEKAPTRAFSWLQVPNSTFIVKTLLKKCAKWALTHGKQTRNWDRKAIIREGWLVMIILYDCVKRWIVCSSSGDTYKTESILGSGYQFESNK